VQVLGQINKNTKRGFLLDEVQIAHKTHTQLPRSRFEPNKDSNIDIIY